MRFILTVLIFCSLTMPSHALTFKSDGSIVQKDGTVVQESTKEKYAKALADFRAGKEVKGFPTARENKSIFGFLGAETKTPKGYFGNDIVENGAPLIPLPGKIDMSDPIASIANNLGMSSKQFTAALVSSASDDWLDQNEISQEVVPIFEETVDTFLEAEIQAETLAAEGIFGINATGISPADIRDGKFDDLFSDPDALLEAAPVLIGAPAEVQMAFQARAESVLAASKGIDLSEFEAVTLDLDNDDLAELAAAAEQETQRLLGQGMNAVNGTDLTVEDVLAGKLDDTIGVSTAIVNASEEVYAAYESRMNRVLAAQAGISLEEINFVNQAVLDAGVTSAEEAGQVAAQAAAQFQNTQGAAAIAQANAAAQEAENLNNIAQELQAIAEAEGTEEARKAAEDAARSAEVAAEAAQAAGEAAMAAAGGAASRSAEEAAWEAASNNAYEQAMSAAMAAGATAEQAAQQAAEAAAAAGQAAFEAASIAAGASAEEAAQQAAAEAAEQSALRDLEARLESGEISEAEFQEAIQNVPPGAD